MAQSGARRDTRSKIMPDFFSGRLHYTIFRGIGTLWRHIQQTRRLLQVKILSSGQTKDRGDSLLDKKRRLAIKQPAFSNFMITQYGTCGAEGLLLQATPTQTKPGSTALELE
jgi:hypothetical protein